MELIGSHAELDGKQIKGWKCDDVVFERHWGRPHELPKHSHAAYQIGTTTRDPGEYHCDGHRLVARPGSMLVFHPGQVHSAPHAGSRDAAAVSRIMFVEPSRLRQIASELAARPVGEPRFPAPVIDDREVVSRFCRVHDLIASDASTLEKEGRLMAWLTLLVARFAPPQAPGRASRWDRARTQAVRDYVESNYAENISLSQLADVAQVSPFHLNRTFAHEVGMPPHAFQTQVRVDRAKPLLLQGVPVVEVAVRTGFFDQSHFTRHFRRIVGVPPRSYVLAAAH